VNFMAGSQAATQRKIQSDMIVISLAVGPDPDFLLRSTHRRPRVRPSVKESRRKLANATDLDRKSGVA
jgi:hypothetical protein